MSTLDAEAPYTDFSLTLQDVEEWHSAKALRVTLLAPGWDQCEFEKVAAAQKRRSMVTSVLTPILMLPALYTSAMMLGTVYMFCRNIPNPDMGLTLAGACVWGLIVATASVLARGHWRDRRRADRLLELCQRYFISWEALGVHEGELGLMSRVPRHQPLSRDDLLQYLRHAKGEDRAEAAQYLYSAHLWQVRQDEERAALKVRQEKALASKRRSDAKKASSRVHAMVRSASCYAWVAPLMRHAHSQQTVLSTSQRRRLKAIAEEIAQLGGQVGPRDEVSLGSIKGSLESTVAALEAMGKGEGFAAASADLDHQLDLTQAQIRDMRARHREILGDQVKAGSLFLESKCESQAQDLRIEGPHPAW